MPFSLITIITPIFNAIKTIEDTLRSVQDQDYPSIEHIVIDGLSTDGTVELLEGREGIRFYSEHDEGIYDAMNKGIMKAKGEIVGILNADDFYTDPKVLSDVAALFEDERIQAVYADLCYVDAENPTKILRYWKAGEFHPMRFFSGWMPPHPTFFVRRGLYEQFGGFDLRFYYSADYEMMLRLLLRAAVPVAYLPRTIVHMRIGGKSNASFGGRWRANREDRKAWTVNRLRPHYWTIWMKPLRKLSQFWKRP